MKRIVVSLLLVLILPLAAAADVNVVSKNAAGNPSFVRGDLGFLPALGLNKAADTNFRLAAKAHLADLVVANFGATGSEELEVTRVRTDELGTVHVRFRQYLNGLQVVGAEMLLHADAETGAIYAINGEFAPDQNVALPLTAKASPAVVRNKLRRLGVAGTAVELPELLYFHDAETGLTHLAWKVKMQGIEDGSFFDNDVYVSVAGDRVLAVDANVHTSRSRNTYDATGSVVTNTSITGLPGDLVCTESNTNCGDSSAQRAHDGAGTVYNYYSSKFGRDSLNGSGMTLVSSVHVGSNWANAAWYNNQMIYGDGDGSSFDDLTKSFDVIAHELTHGVTDYESNLLYQKESGALNEAFSDIFGVSADSYRRGGVVDSSTWKLGEEVYIAGDALRYMNDPDADGYSKGYYPERLYSGSCSPSNSNDQCGVHGNSGIANLAYYLMVSGGTHPRGKTSVNVPALGMAKAEKIFYRAQTTYLTSSSNFEAARNATAQAALDLYGQSNSDSVHLGWDAVGVPGGPPAPAVELQNGVAQTGLSGSTGDEARFTANLTSGSSNLSFAMSGGSGDADLYVKFGSEPTTSSYDCRPYKNGNSETCSFASPSTGTYYVMVRAYSSYSNVSLTASWTTSTPNNPPSAGFTHTTSDLTASFTDTSSDSDGTISSWSWTFGDGGTSSAQNPSHTYSSAGTYTVGLTVTDNDGDTDSASASVTVTAPPSGGSELQNGVPVTGLSDSSGGQVYYTVAIPSGASDLSISISGGSGDADLYVKFGSDPTTSSYDCRPYKSGNNESCSFASPSTGTYHVMIRAYSSYSGVTLTATWTEGGGGGSCTNSGSAANISGSTGNEKRYTWDVPSCATKLTVTLSGGSGDADLYVKFGSDPTRSSYDCRSWNSGNSETCTFNSPSTGTYHILVYAYSTYSGATLTATYE